MNQSSVALTHKLSRRGLIRTFAMVPAAAGFGLPMLLSACGSPVPAPPSTATARTSPTSVVANTQVPTSAVAGSASADAFPAYAPAEGGSKPDFPSIGPLYEDGFTYFPKNPVKLWTKEPPGSGGNVSVFSSAINPVPPTPFDHNQAWKEVNRQLNANVQFSISPAADYNAKLATLMAGNDLPDIMLFRNGVNAAASLPQFLQQSMADLTPYLAGDGAREYPFLAAIPTFAWKNSGCVVNGHLYMVPVERYRLGTAFLRNTTIYDKEIGVNYVPKNADDFKRVLLQLTNPDAGRWGTASYQGVGFGIAMYASMFGAPNNWLLDSGGKLTKDLETPEYKEAVGYVRDLFAAGVFHPDSLSATDINVNFNGLLGGKFALAVQAYGVTWTNIWRQGLAQNPPVNFQPIDPFAAHEGVKPRVFLGPGFLVTNGLKKASPERIKEVLRIMDWLAVPFGSTEDLLLTYGVPDIDYTIDADGHPATTANSDHDAAGVPWKYIVQHPAVANAVGLPEYAKAAVDAEHLAIPLGVDDPILGFVSLTNSSKGVPLNNTFLDGVTDVVAGRRPFGEYDELVSDWQSGGGEQIRAEYQKQIAAAHSS